MKKIIKRLNQNEIIEIMVEKTDLDKNLGIFRFLYNDIVKIGD